MEKTSCSIIKKCRELRRRGCTLNKIIENTNLSKTTAYKYIYDIPLSSKAKEEIKKEATKRIIKFNLEERKGKCVPGRIIRKPKKWTAELIFLTAHFMFDGEIKKVSCVYQNRSLFLINSIKKNMKTLFGLTPYYKFYEKTGVHRISYHHVELANYFKSKAQKIKQYIRRASLVEKKIFLRAFFDDEGCAYKYKNNRKIRGYQNNLEILNLIKGLLKNFDIESKVDVKYKEIVISKKQNLINFQNKINFSKKIYINPDRKNSIWKQKLEKRKILDYLINSYKK